MSYQVLARKWRPQNFKQMVGQEHVLQALIHALDSQRLHHAYLFTGTRGVGKTTIGRILAKCLSCHVSITSEPCGECGACQGIAEGRYVDLIEIDAASRTKVEDMRELLDNVQYAPTQGRFKIYLIDEVHMLSSSSFNALLKTLEEPPSHVKFLFATTDPQKLPVTILSRCLQFNLKNMSPERIVGHLKYILSEEQVTAEEAALWALARAADGSMRDALSLTDQAIAYGNQVLSETGVSAMLGTVDQKRIYRLLDALIAQDPATLLDEVAALAEFSPDYSAVLAALISVLHRVAVEQVLPGSVDNAVGDQAQVRGYAKSLTAEDLQLFYQIALVSRQDLAITPDPRAGLEMALLRMLAFQLEPPSQSPQDLPALSQASSATPAASIPAASEPLSPQPGAEAPPVTQTAGPSPESHSDHNIEQAIEQSPADVAELPPLDQYAEDLHAVSQAESGPDELESEIALQSSKKKTVLVDGSDARLATDPQQLDVCTVETIESREPETTQSDQAGWQQAEQEAASIVDALTTSAPPDEILNEAVATPDDNNAELSSMAWPTRAMSLPVSGMTQNLLLNMTLIEAPSTLTLFVDSGHYRLLNNSHQSRIEAAMKQTFGEDKVLKFVDGLQPEHETPMMWKARRRAEMLVQAKQTIQDDPKVKALLATFDARVVEESIQALGKLT